MKNIFSFFAIRLFLSTMAAQPSIQWQKTLGSTEDDFASSIQVTNEGGYIVAGYTNDTSLAGSHGGYDAWIVKLSALGEIQWQKLIGGSDEDKFASIAQTNDHGYIVAGTTRSNDGDVSGNHGDFDIFVLKLNEIGEIEWKKTLGGSDWDQAASVRQTYDGGFIVSGWTASNDGDITVNHGGRDYWVVKLSSSGLLQWQKS